MGFDLSKIQSIVQEYANVISQVSGVDVEVVDNTLFRIAGTGIYASGVNIDMSDEGHVYKHILNTGETQIIYCPGEDSLCRGCPNRSNCKETIEVSMPIKSDEEIIGIIGLVGSTLEQKEIILENESLYLEFIKQIAYFIAAKAKEAKEREISYATISVLDSVINFMDQGVLLISKDNIIMSGNQSARKYLGISNVEGKKIKITSTGDLINDTLEYKLTLENKDIYAIGVIHPLEIKSDRYNNIFIFKNMKQVQADLYEVTSTLKTVETKNIIGGSKATSELKYNIRKVAGSKSTVLITGESGTGKEMVATAIWRESERRNQKFVAVNCAAIPESLLESELFGYVKGAFSGADPRGRIGKFELANHGIIFLDEIGDMPIYLQGKLLRVLQEKSITRIGSNQVIPIDVRVIAATNKDLKEMMLQKKFREDLYYRLNVIPISIQPLRERPQDIKELVKFFIEKYVLLLEKSFNYIPVSTMRLLENRYWKGNVRELENTIEFMVNMMEGDGILDNKTLPLDFFEDISKKDNKEHDYCYNDDVITLKELEKREVEKASIIFGHSTEGKKKAADSLGISLATYYRKLREHLDQ
jgi:transcriptional regulator with PAS, ATPase and Fis domain